MYKVLKRRLLCQNSMYIYIYTKIRELSLFSSITMRQNKINGVSLPRIQINNDSI